MIEKETVHVSKSRLRVFPGKVQALKWLLSLCERGIYITDLHVLDSDGQIHTRASGSGTDPDPNLRTFRRAGKVGRPPDRKRKGEDKIAKRKRQNREAAARYRANKAQKDKGP